MQREARYQREQGRYRRDIGGAFGASRIPRGFQSRQFFGMRGGRRFKYAQAGGFRDLLLHQRRLLLTSGKGLPRRGCR